MLLQELIATPFAEARAEEEIGSPLCIGMSIEEQQRVIDALNVFEG